MDGMGIGILVPTLNVILINSHTAFFATHMSASSKNFVYGIVMSVFAFAWFIGSSLLGDLSDRTGRKFPLIISLTGTFFSYALTAVAVLAHSLTLIIVGRVLGGLCAGSQPLAQAAIVDIAPKHERATFIGMMMMALSFGLMAGPAIGGVLADPHVVSWFSPVVPFYFAMLMSFLNLILLFALFKETYVPTVVATKFDWFHVIEIFVSAFKHKTIRPLSFMFMSFQGALNICFAFLVTFMMLRYAYTAAQVGVYMAVFGAGFAFGFGFLAGFCEKRFNPAKSLLVVQVLASVCLAIFTFWASPWPAWIVAFPLGMLLACSYTTAVSVFSHQVGEDKQGWVMGVTSAISALAAGVAYLLSGVLMAYWTLAPMVLALSLMVIAFVLMWGWRKRYG
jgi:MFS family permease